MSNDEYLIFLRQYIIDELKKGPEPEMLQALAQFIIAMNSRY